MKSFAEVSFFHFYRYQYYCKKPKYPRKSFYITHAVKYYFFSYKKASKKNIEALFLIPFPLFFKETHTDIR